MDNIEEPELEFETLAAALKLEKMEAKQLVESLATMLQLSLPDNVTITRGGWLLSREKPVQELMVRFEEFHYQLTRERTGGYTARVLKVVRGIALKSTEIGLEQCFSDILTEVSNLAGKNASARHALNKFIAGR